MSGSLYNPSVEQQVIIVCRESNADYDSGDNSAEVNQALQAGWQVVSVTGAGAGAGSKERWLCAVCFFVVLERRRQ